MQIVAYPKNVTRKFRDCRDDPVISVIKWNRKRTEKQFPLRSWDGEIMIRDLERETARIDVGARNRDDKRQSQLVVNWAKLNGKEGEGSR